VLVLRQVASGGEEAHRRADGLHLRRVHRPLQRHHRRGGRSRDALRRSEARSRSRRRSRRSSTSTSSARTAPRRSSRSRCTTTTSASRRRGRARRRRAPEVEHPAHRPDRHGQDAARADARAHPQRAVRDRRRHHADRGRLRRRGRREHHRPAAAERRPRRRARAARHRLHRRDRQDRAQGRQPLDHPRRVGRGRAAGPAEDHRGHGRQRAAARAAASTRSRSSCRSTRPTSSSSAAAPSSGSTRSSSAHRQAASGFGAEVRARRSASASASCSSRCSPRTSSSSASSPSSSGACRSSRRCTSSTRRPHRHPHRAEERADQAVPALFEMDGVKLKFTAARCVAVARRRSKRKAGARGLRAILENAMLDIMYEIPSRAASRRSSSTRRSSSASEKPLIVYDKEAEAPEAGPTLRQPPSPDRPSESRHVLQGEGTRGPSADGGASLPAAAAARHHRLPAHGRAALRRPREVHRAPRGGDGHDKEILLAAQKKAKTNDPTPDDIFKVGTLGTIIQLLRLPDGTVKVLVEGKRARASSASSRPTDFPRRGRGDRRAVEESVEVEALMRSVQSTFETYVKLNKRVPPEMLMSACRASTTRRASPTPSSPTSPQARRQAGAARDREPAPAWRSSTS
jgi:hypothetical protein